MGWGLTVKEFFVPNITKDELKYEIKKKKELIESYETEIKMLISSDPVSFNKINDDNETWVDWLPNHVSNLLYEYREAINRLNSLIIADENESKNN